jgi:hypothetical protein
MEPKCLLPCSEERSSEMYFKPRESISHRHTRWLWTTLVNVPSMTKYFKESLKSEFLEKENSINIYLIPMYVFFFFLDLVTLIIFEEE